MLVNIRCSVGIIFGIALCFVGPLRGVVIGSNTAPSRQALANFPAIDNDNEMRGFAAFENGFTLADNTTTCIYNSFFPVLGTITFNGGTLNLSKNLLLGSTVTFADGGTIQASDLTIFFPDITGIFSFGGAMTFDTARLVLNSSVALNGAVTFNNSCSIDGNGYSIDCASGSIAVGSGASLLIKNSSIEGITAGKISCASTSSTLSLQDVRWIQEGDYTFSQGKLEVINKLEMTGEYVFTYSTDQVSTVTTNSEWFFDSGMTFKYAPTGGASNLISLTDHSSVLRFYEATLHATSAGLDLTKGTVIVEGTCPVNSEATVAADGVNFGDNTSMANDIDIKILPESGLRLDAGFVNEQNVG